MEQNNLITIDGEPLSVFIDSGEIKRHVDQLAQTIHADLKGEVPVFLCVLKGAFMFVSDLMRAYPGDCEVSFIRLSSYEGTASTGKVKTTMGVTDNIRNRAVVIVEDIIDTGLTMQHLIPQIESYGPKSVKVAALFLKPEKLACDVQIDYHCFEIPNKFIVGYGLDCDERYRNLPDIFAK